MPAGAHGVAAVGAEIAGIAALMPALAMREVVMPAVNVASFRLGPRTMYLNALCGRGMQSRVEEMARSMGIGTKDASGHQRKRRYGCNHPHRPSLAFAAHAGLLITSVGRLMAALCANFKTQAYKTITAPCLLQVLVLALADVPWRGKLERE